MTKSVRQIAKQFYNAKENKEKVAENTLYSRLLKLNKKQDVKLNVMTDEEIDIFLHEHQKELFTKKESPLKQNNKTTETKNDKNIASHKPATASSSHSNVEQDNSSTVTKEAVTGKTEQNNSNVDNKPLQTAKFPKQVYELKKIADKLHVDIALSTVYQLYLKYGNKPAKIFKNGGKQLFVQTKNKTMTLKKWLKHYYKQHKNVKRNKKSFNKMLFELKLKAAKAGETKNLTKKQVKTWIKEILNSKKK